METKELLKKAYLLAQKYSDDPLTQNGAILVNRENHTIGQGTNCLPNGVQKHQHRLERPEKYNYLLHAEQHAIADAAKHGHATLNATLYCPWAACTACAKVIIQAGISKVVTHAPLIQKSHLHWVEEINKARQMFNEANITYYEFDEKIGNIEHLFDGKIWNP